MNINQLSEIIFCLLWLAGIAIAKGIEETTLAIVFPPYALYLFVERILIVSGLIG